MNPNVTQKVITRPDPATQDSGKVRLGYTSQPFPPVRSDPPTVVDGGKVRLGYTSPPFPRKR
jgi:hypothetical protein